MAGLIASSPCKPFQHTAKSMPTFPIHAPASLFTAIPHLLQSCCLSGSRVPVMGLPCYFFTAANGCFTFPSPLLPKLIAIALLAWHIAAHSTVFLFLALSAAWLSEEESFPQENVNDGYLERALLPFRASVHTSYCQQHSKDIEPHITTSQKVNVERPSKDG